MNKVVTPHHVCFFTQTLRCSQMVIVITQFDSLAHVHSVYEDEELALLHFLPIEVLYVCF
jgi:hypothetical protein